MKNWCCLTASLMLFALPALAGPPVIDGSASDTLYPPDTPLVIQDTQTNFGNASLGRPDACNGSELDAAYGVIYNGTLYLTLAGNFEDNGNRLEIFFDTRAGGQNRLLSTNPGTPNVGLLRMSDDGSGNGLTFQFGFEADFWVSVNCYGRNPTNLYVDYAELYVNAGNPGVSYYCGAGLTKCETLGGVLTGGDLGAPAILCTVDNSNIYGVDGGVGGSDGSGVLTGMELAIPLAALGNPTDEIWITTFINGQQHDFVSNQVLGGLAGLVGDNLGEPRNVNFGTVAFGIQQPFAVPVAPTPTGACCIGTACSIRTQANCVSSGGVYQGDNSNCDGNPCDATPAGRCCIDDGYSGQCLIRTQAQCTSLGGTWGGAGTTCEGCPCLLAATGACCVANTCSVVTAAECAALGGIYQGDYTNCDSSPCEAGACCDGLVCTETRRFECTGLTVFFPGVTCASNPCAEPTIATPYAAGQMQSPNQWDAGADPMIETAPGSRIWTITFSGLTVNGRYEWKVTDGTWTHNLPSANSWFYASAAGDITLTYDSNFYSDGWSPTRDRLGVSVDAGTWTAVGDFLSELGGADWNNADPHGAMAPQGGGIHKLEVTGLPAATYAWKAVKTGTWDSISWDARSVNTANWQFTVGAATDTVAFWVDGLVGRAKVEVTAAPEYCLGDLNCDGQVAFSDINAFVLYLSNTPAWLTTYPGCPLKNGDINDDDSYPGFGDINPFVTLLSTSSLPIICP